MTSIQFVVHPLPGTQEQLADKLKSVADKLNKYGLQGNVTKLNHYQRNGIYIAVEQRVTTCNPISGSTALTNIREEVKQIAVGPSHFALLFEDGRLARLPFSVISDRLDLSKTSNKNNNSKGSGGSGGGGGGGGRTVV